MKISDNQLVSSIFIEILNNLPKSITMNYACGMKGIVKDNDFWRSVGRIRFYARGQTQHFRF